MKTRTRILLAAALGVWLTMPNTNRIHDPVRSPDPISSTSFQHLAVLTVCVAPPTIKNLLPRLSFADDV